MYTISSTVTLTNTLSHYTWLLWDKPGEHIVTQNSPEHFDNIYTLFLDRLDHLKRIHRQPKKLEKTELLFIFESLLEVKEAMWEDVEL